jgi:hypothetical protein
MAQVIEHEALGSNPQHSKMSPTEPSSASMGCCLSP